MPFFYADAQRSYFVLPTIYWQHGNYFTTAAPTYGYHPFYQARYTFAPFYHGFVPLLVRELNRGGVDRLYRRDLQLDPAGVQGSAPFDFRRYYQPTDNVIAYNPQTNAWETLPSLPAPRQGLVVSLVGNQIVVALGGTQTDAPQNTTWVGIVQGL